MSFKYKKIIYLGLILLTLGIVLYIGARSGDLPASLRAIMGIPPVCVAAGVICVFGGILMATVSCALALRRLGQRISFGQLCAIMMLGEFYANITPGASGGQPMQVYVFHRRGVAIGEATAALTVHYHAFRLSLLMFDGVLYVAYRDFIRAQIGPHMPLLVLGVVCNALLVGGALLITFYQRPVRFLLEKLVALMRRFKIGNPEKLEKLLNGLADNYFTGMRTLCFDIKQVAAQFAVAAIRILLLMSVMYFIYRGLGRSEASYGQIVALSSMQYTSAAYTPLPGASGAQEGTFSLFFANLLPGSLLLSALLCWRFITYYLVLIVGFIVTTAMGVKSEE